MLSLHSEQARWFLQQRDFFPGQRGAPWLCPSPGEGALGGLHPMAHPCSSHWGCSQQGPWPFLGLPLDNIYSPTWLGIFLIICWGCIDLSFLFFFFFPSIVASPSSNEEAAGNLYPFNWSCHFSDESALFLANYTATVFRQLYSILTDWLTILTDSAAWAALILYYLWK